MARGIVRDLGGADALSTQQLAPVDVLVRTKLLLDGVDSYVLGMPSPVNKQRRQLLAVVVQRASLRETAYTTEQRAPATANVAALPRTA